MWRVIVQAFAPASTRLRNPNLAGRCDSAKKNRVLSPSRSDKRRGASLIRCRRWVQTSEIYLTDENLQDDARYSNPRWDANAGFVWGESFVFRRLLQTLDSLDPTICLLFLSRPVQWVASIVPVWYTQDCPLAGVIGNRFSEPAEQVPRTTGERTCKNGGN